MTDNEIIKALKDEIRRANYIESYYIDCVDIGVFQNALDLINRQKAEIERLQNVIFKKEDTMQMIAKEKQEYFDKLQTVKSEAIKRVCEEVRK